MEQIKTGKFIAELRKGKGMTQEQLGARLGVNSRSGKMVMGCRISHCYWNWRMCWG